MATKIKTEKKQHIQVFARVRPLSNQELRSQVVVECINGKEVSVRDKNQTKTFTFDRVFGPNSKQVEVYKAVVSPLISEVLQGYNCTVFAYGQTGTGKTFTMVGEKSGSSNGNWEDDPSCGVIPRTLSHLFDELKVRADEFTVRVSFLELYNEELCDLLSPIDNEDVKTLKLFEDSMKKGSVIVSGLEERTVHNKNDVYAILETGNLRRQTAPTLMNAQSSRSHTIFTITVHIKVTTPEGEDLIKTGKLNLVDLAGSENIGRSGAVEMRAREAGSINQSLLTLGRVITALVERKPHVPYRESKLTRILQDSLGGRTKTSIIATVSPAFCNIEETLSTFDYAHRARNITNKPEINQKTSKRVLLKEYTEEIERLRRDLIATREKHGVYLASENYNAIMAERENLNKELVSKLQLLKVREDELLKQEEIMKNLDMNLYATQNELAATNQKLEEATKLCTEKDGMLNQLELQTDVLIKTANEAVNDAKTLHERLAKSRRILENNFFSSEKFKSDFCWNLNNMRTRTKEFERKMVYEIDNQIEMDKKFVSSLVNNQLELKQMANNVITEASTQIQSVFDSIKSQMLSNEMFFNEQLTALKEIVEVENEKAQEIINGLMLYTDNMLPKWNRLLEHLEMNKFGLEKLKTDVKSMEERLLEITNMTLLLTKLCEEKIEKREDALKSYAEKCEFLEKKQSTVKNRMKELGHALYKMAQEHLDLIQKENECDEALATLINDRSGEEKYFFNEMGDVVRKKTAEIQTCAEEAGKMNGDIANLTNELIDTTQTKIYSLAKSVFSSEENKYVEMKKALSDSFSSLGFKCNKLIDEFDLQSQKIKDYGPEVENKKSDIAKNFSLYMEELESNMEHQRIYAEENLQERILKEQTLSLNMMKHSEEMSLNLHERLKEIDSFFMENIKKDEKTGSTPQRKEFNYPRRIMGFLKKGKPEDCEPEKSPIFNSFESPENGRSFDSPNP